jgi:hypothetical protein
MNRAQPWTNPAVNSISPHDNPGSGFSASVFADNRRFENQPLSMWAVLSAPPGEFMHGCRFEGSRHSVRATTTMARFA